MTLFNVFSLLGGLALFLFGMDTMGNALEKQAGGTIAENPQQADRQSHQGLLASVSAVTAVIQSPPAPPPCMVVGFVNSGIMELHQAIGVIIGSNVGTTVTSWLLSLSGLQGDSIWSSRCSSQPPSARSCAFIGIAAVYGARARRKRASAPSSSASPC